MSVPPTARHLVLKRPLHYGQQAALSSTKPQVFIVAGTGGGKTSFAPVWAMAEHQRCVERRGNDSPINGMVVAPYKILTTTTIPAFLRLFRRKFNLGDWESKGDRIFGLHSGGHIYFRSAESPESVEGAHIDWAVMDECGQRSFARLMYDALLRRLSLREGRLLGTTTLYYVGWLDAITHAAESQDHNEGARLGIDVDQIEVIRFPSTANPGYPLELFEQKRRTLPDWQFRLFHLGERARPEGLVYEMMTDEHWINADDIPHGPEENPDHWPVYAGADFGFENPTAVLYASLSPDDVLYVFDEYYERRRTDAANARAAPHAGVRMAYADPSAPEAIAEFREQGWRITGCPRHEKRLGITEVIERINTGRLRWVRGRLEQHQREIDSYHWDDKHPDQVVKVDDHTVDCLEYLCWGLKHGGIVPLGDQQTAPGRLAGLPGRTGAATYPDDVVTVGRRRGGSRLSGLPGAVRR